jgi:hypothetical protein
MDDLCMHKKAPALVGLSRREVAGSLMRNVLATPP